MTQTITRERRLKFDAILIEEGIYSTSKVDRDRLTEKLALASLSRDERKTDEEKGEYKHKLPENSDIAFLLANDQHITDESQNEKTIEHNALVAFEASYNAPPSNLKWYSGKPDWKDLREFVVAQYKLDNKCFEEYAKWRKTPYVSGAVSLVGVRKDPLSFIASWAVFTESKDKTESKEAKPSRRSSERLTHDE